MPTTSTPRTERNSPSPNALHLRGTGLGLRFADRWVFAHVDVALGPGESLGIGGPNGSGKTSLLGVLAGYLTPSLGNMEYVLNGEPLKPWQWHRHLAWMGPNLALYPELKVHEMLRQHFALRNCLLQGPDDVLQAMDLAAHRNKRLAQLSSGMLQRLRLGMALFTTSGVLFLDEPTSFLDDGRARAFWTLADAHLGQRLLVLATNRPDELERCPQRIWLGPGEKEV